MSNHNSKNMFWTIPPISRSFAAMAVSAIALPLFLILAFRLLLSYPLNQLDVEPVKTLILPANQSAMPVGSADLNNSEDFVIQEVGNIVPDGNDGKGGTVTKDNVESSGKNDVYSAPPRDGGNGGGAKHVESDVGNAGVVNSDDKVKMEMTNDKGNVDNSGGGSAAVVSEEDGGGTKAVDSRSCNLYKGKWIYDYMGPLYTNNSCPTLTQMQNCQGNGRPDKDYENWRWKPEHCELPRFDAKKYLELMRGKTLAFIGDSVARNQMESLLCMLWQVETPRNRGNRRMQRWFFQSTSTAIVRIWSSWLVHKTSEPFQSIPEGVVKVFLDLPDEDFMEFLPRFDVVVLSSGHWFAKQSAYILNGTIVGGQLWWPKDAGQMKVNNIDAFGISVETCLTAIASHPNFSGKLAIVRSYSPDHYEGGAWNTGGSCTGKKSPVTELVRNEFTEVMHKKQVDGFEKAKKAAGKNGSKMILMDITEAYGYRADGHPGPYRSPDPNKITKRGPNGEPPPQDCLHWCMPGPIDTWNEFLLEVIRRDFEQA